MLKDKDICIGAVVSHSQWGVGLIVGFENEGERLLIDFHSKPGHSMARGLAIRSLALLPEDGLDAGLKTNREEVLRWQEKDPMRLVAAALVDLGGKARTSDLKSRLANKVIDPEDWSRWWKRVQNALKESNQFSYDPRKGVSLDANPADIQSVSLDELPASPRNARPKTVRTDPATRLAEWVTWVQSDEKPDATPGGVPPEALLSILQELPASITSVSINRLVFGIEQRILASKKPSASSSQIWMKALVAVLQRWLGSSNAPEIPLTSITALVARVLEDATLDSGKEATDWLAEYASRSKANVDDLAQALLSASRETPDGIYHMLLMMHRTLDTSTRVALWQQLVQPISYDASMPRTGQWLRILEPVERAEVLWSLLLTVLDKASIAEIGSLLQKEWSLSDVPERGHLFKVVLLAWLSHEQLRPACKTMLETVTDSGRDDHSPEDSHMAEWKQMAQSLAQNEIEHLRVSMEREMDSIRGILRDAEGASDRAERQAKYLQGELQKASRGAALDLKRDAILVLGETLQQLVASPDPSSRKVEDATAGIMLALAALGADTFGEVGETLPFNPKIHEVSQPPAIGAPVRTIAPGLRYVKDTDSTLVLVRIQAEVGNTI